MRCKHWSSLMKNRKDTARMKNYFSSFDAPIRVKADEGYIKFYYCGMYHSFSGISVKDARYLTIKRYSDYKPKPIDPVRVALAAPVEV